MSESQQVGPARCGEQKLAQERVKKKCSYSEHNKLIIEYAEELLNEYNLIPIAVNTRDYKYMKTTKKGKKIEETRSKKSPIEYNWQETKKEDAIKKLKYESKKKMINLGILTGKSSNIFVVDVDVDDKGVETWKKLTEGKEIDTMFQDTPSGGYHYIFKYDDRLDRFKGGSKVLKYNGEKIGIDFRTNGNQIIMAPSKYEKGSYVLHASPINRMPDWLYDVLTTNYYDQSMNMSTKLNRDSNKKNIDFPHPHDDSKGLDINEKNATDLLKKSIYWNDALLYDGIDQLNRVCFKGNEPYMCSVCQRMHTNNENRSYIKKTQNGVFYGCRDGVAKLYTGLDKGKCLLDDGETEENILPKASCLLDDTKEKILPKGKCLVDDTKKVSGKTSVGKKPIRLNPNIKEALKDNSKDGELPEMEKKIWAAINLMTSGRCADIAYLMLKGKYVVTSRANPVWYMFNGNIWIEMKGEGQIMYELEINVTKPIQKILDKQIKLRASLPKAFIAAVDLRIKKLMSLLTQFSDTTKRKPIIDDLKVPHRLLDTFFYKNLDTKSYLLGFDNVIYDLKNMIFRKGTPEDMVSLSVGYNFVKLAEDDENLIAVRNFISSLFSTEEMMLFSLRVAASFLEGVNPNEVFYLWIGFGRNGKSKYLKLISTSLGQYAVNIPISLFLNNKITNGNSPSPELLKMKGARLICASEPPKGVGISETVKPMTGNDIMSVRGLYKDPVEFTVTGKIAISTNHYLQIDADEHAMYDRMVPLKFPYKFVDKPSNDMEKPINRKIEELIPIWRLAMMNIMLNEYQNYKEKGLQIPESIKDDILDLKLENDIVQYFIDEKLEITNDRNDYISRVDIWKMYCEFKKEIASDKKDKQNDFYQEIGGKIKTFEKHPRLKIKNLEENKETEIRPSNVFTHLKIREIGDEEEDEDESAENLKGECQLE